MAEDVRAEIVASVLEVVVSKGDQIGPGDTLVLLESMKMEIAVRQRGAELRLPAHPPGKRGRGQGQGGDEDEDDDRIHGSANISRRPPGRRANSVGANL